MEKKLICRKCEGNHFTIKCSSINKENTNKEIKITEFVEPVKHTKIDESDTNTVKVKYNSDTKQRENHRYDVNKHKQFSRVKISELPIDMTEEELMELTHDWGYIHKVKVLNYEDTSIAYVDFDSKDEADYFIKALDKTPFESLLLSVCHAESRNY